eukprot:TRINITY_DN592_c0_g1_i2.p1 TRINITY_DN592_c0_g1~~TRINITY_DN592_c0_g1_i2.p1  ORF type:complete len:450 (+),score=83.31 TRINITY_DN592_c0_g1_i2:97-1446(+)
MTGRHPFRIGMQHFDTLIPGTLAHLPYDQPTLAEMFKAQGYRTAMLGKWHLGYAHFNNTPTGRGFDSFMGYFQGQNDYFWGYFNATGAGSNVNVSNGYDRWHNQTADWDTFGEWGTEVYLAEVDRIVRDAAASGTPFFLYWANQEIHIPTTRPPNKKFLDACATLPDSPYPMGECGTKESDDCCPPNRRVLCAMMAEMDNSLSVLLSTIKNNGLWDDTLIWTTTDNGGMTSFRYNFPSSASSNWPLRAGKTTIFEGGVRGVSFLAGGANVLPATAAGTKVTGLGHAIDVFPTLAGLIGAKVSPVVDGIDLWPAIAHGTPVNRTELALNVDRTFDILGITALIQNEWKLIIGEGPLGVGMYDGWWQNDPYIHIPPNDTEKLYLFNLTSDPTEHHNLARDFPDVVKTMVARLHWYADEKNGYMPTQENNPCRLEIQPCYRTHFNNTWSPWL